MLNKFFGESNEKNLSLHSSRASSSSPESGSYSVSSSIDSSSSSSSSSSFPLSSLLPFSVVSTSNTSSSCSSVSEETCYTSAGSCFMMTRASQVIPLGSKSRGMSPCLFGMSFLASWLISAVTKSSRPWLAA